MLQKIDWNIFKVKNENQTKSFEDLCYHLFCREHEISDGIKADFNQVGLETFPIKSNKKNKVVGFQAKFFEPKISYPQIKKSIQKAIANYKKEKLEQIYIYLNTDAKISSKAANEIVEIAKIEGIEIFWMTKSQLAISLNKQKNIDLAQLYFGFGDELGFIKTTLKKEEVTFLNSIDFIKLPLIDDKNNIVEIDLKTNKTILITGNPGSGKSQLMKSLFLNYSGFNLKKEEYISLLKNQAIPMLINLKDCFTDSLENIIRNRQRDYKIRKNKLKFIYLFDGLDELNESKAEQIINYFNYLESDSNTANIIISCRKGNLNRLKVVTQISEISKYTIDNLDESYMSTYFKNKNNFQKDNKLENLKLENIKLINEINDIYLIKVLWDIIEELHSKTTIIHLIEHKVNQLINNSIHKNEIQTLNLLNPKQFEILNLNNDVAYKFSKRFQYRFKQEELQKLILKKYPKLDYTSTNDILNYNSSLFFDISESDNLFAQSFIYEHRRYQEYFYARKIKSKYEKSPKVIRKNDLYINSDFFQDILLNYLRSEYEKDLELNLPFLLELNLINVYSGNNRYYGADEPYFKNSNNFHFSLSKQNSRVLEELINDESLNLRNYLIFSYNDVQLFFENGHVDFAEQILNEIESISDYEIQLNEHNGFFFVSIKIYNEIDYVEYFKKKLRKYYKSFSDIKDFLNNDQSDQEVIVKSYFRIGLKYNLENLVKLIKYLNDFEFICLLDLLTEVDNLKLLLDNLLLINELQKRVKKYKTEPKLDNLSVYFFYKYFEISISEDFIAKVQISLANVSDRINSYFFDRYIKYFGIAEYIVGEAIFF